MTDPGLDKVMQLTLLPRQRLSSLNISVTKHNITWHNITVPIGEPASKKQTNKTKSTTTKKSYIVPSKTLHWPISWVCCYFPHKGQQAAETVC